MRAKRRRRLPLLLAAAALVGMAAVLAPSAGPTCAPVGEEASRPDDSPLAAFSRALTDAFGPIIGYPLSYVRWRRGYLEADPAFRARLTELLQPLDIVVVKNGFKLTDTIIPGLFSYAAIWLGDEARLRRAGLWEHPSVRPLQAAIREGRTLIEAVPQGTDIVPIDRIVDSDRLAVLRARAPDGDAAEWRCDLATLAIGQLQQPYDYGFDIDSRERVSCAELVYRAFRGVAWETRRLFGRRTILPDDIIRLGLSETVGVDVAAYFVGAPDASWRQLPVEELRAEFQAMCEGE